MKLKKSTTVPLALLIYLIAISIYAYPGRKPDVSWGEYGFTIGITLVCIILISYLYRRRDKYRDQMNKNKPK